MQFKQKVSTRTTRPASRRVAKARPINVNFPLPKAAVARLRDLAISRDQRLLNLGVLAVQIRDDESIVLGIELEKTKKKPIDRVSVPKKSGQAQKNEATRPNFPVTSAMPIWRVARDSTSVGFQRDNLGGLRAETSTESKGTQSSAVPKQRGKRSQGPRRGRPPTSSVGSKMEHPHPLMNISLGASTWEAVYRNIGTPSERRPLKRSASVDLPLENPPVTRGFGDGNIAKSADGKRVKVSPRVSSPIHSDPDDGMSSVSSSPCSHSPMNSDELLNLFIDEKFSATSVLRQLAESHSDVQNSGVNGNEEGRGQTGGTPVDSNAPGDAVSETSSNQQASSTCEDPSTNSITTQCELTPGASNFSSSSEQDVSQIKPTLHHVAANMLSNFSSLHATDSSNLHQISSDTEKSFPAKSPNQSPSPLDNRNSTTSFSPAETVSLTNTSCSPLQSTSVSSSWDFNTSSPTYAVQGCMPSTPQNFMSSVSSSSVMSRKPRSFAQLGIFPENYRRENMLDLKSTTRAFGHPSRNPPTCMQSYPNKGSYYMQRQMFRGFPGQSLYSSTINLPVESTAPSRISHSQGHLGYYAVAGNNNTTTMSSSMNNTTMNNGSAHPMSSLPNETSSTSNHVGITSYPVQAGNPHMRSQFTSRPTSAPEFKLPSWGAPERGHSAITSTEVLQPEIGSPAAFPETAALPDKTAELGSANENVMPTIAGQDFVPPMLPAQLNKGTPASASHSITPASRKSGRQSEENKDSYSPPVSSSVSPGIYNNSYTTDVNNNARGNTGPQYALSYVYPMGTVWYPYVAVTPYAMLVKNASKKQEATKENTLEVASGASEVKTTEQSTGLASTVSSAQYIDLASSLRYWQQLSLLYKSRMQLGANGAGLQYSGSSLNTGFASEVPPSGVPASDVPASGAPASGVPASDAPASGAPASDAPASGVPASGVPASNLADEFATTQHVTLSESPETQAVSTACTTELLSDSKDQVTSSTSENNSPENRELNDYFEQETVNEKTDVTEVDLSTCVSKADTISDSSDNVITVMASEDTSIKKMDTESRPSTPYNENVKSDDLEQQSLQEPNTVEVPDKELCDSKVQSPPLMPNSAETECICPQEKKEMGDSDKTEHKEDSNDEQSEEDETELASESKRITRSMNTKTEESQKKVESGSELNFIHEDSIAYVNVGNHSSTQTTEEPKKSGNGKSRSSKRKKSRSR